MIQQYLHLGSWPISLSFRSLPFQWFQSRNNPDSYPTYLFQNQVISRIHIFVWWSTGFDEWWGRRYTLAAFPDEKHIMHNDEKIVNIINSLTCLWEEIPAIPWVTECIDEVEIQ